MIYFLFILTVILVCFLPAKILHKTLLPKVNSIVLALITYLAIAIVTYLILSLKGSIHEDGLVAAFSVFWPVLLFGQLPGLPN